MLARRREDVLEGVPSRAGHTLVLIRLRVLLRLHKKPLELVVELCVDLHRGVGVQHRPRRASRDVLPRQVQRQLPRQVVKLRRVDSEPSGELGALRH